MRTSPAPFGAARDTCRGRRPSRRTRARGRRSASARDPAATNVPQTGSRTICTPRDGTLPPRRGPAADPVGDAVDQTPEARARRGCASTMNRTRRSSIRHPASWPTPACADVRLSSARLAAWPSGPSGAIAITCCHAASAPSRSCLPNALTMPTLSSVLACLGSSFNDVSNCASALSGWFE